METEKEWNIYEGLSELRGSSRENGDQGELPRMQEEDEGEDPIEDVSSKL